MYLSIIKLLKFIISLNTALQHRTYVYARGIGSCSEVGCYIRTRGTIMIIRTNLYGEKPYLFGVTVSRAALFPTPTCMLRMCLYVSIKLNHSACRVMVTFILLKTLESKKEYYNNIYVGWVYNITV